MLSAHVCMATHCSHRLWNDADTCCLSILVQNFPEEDPDAPVEFRYMCGDTDHSGALIEAGVTEADAIIIGGQDDLPDNEVRAFAFLLQLWPTMPQMQAGMHAQHLHQSHCQPLPVWPRSSFCHCVWL